jgi:hypothetical protein
MKITCEHFADQFNVSLSSKDGVEPFLVVKGCRIKEGTKGRFISWPASPPKQQGGKWWNHVYASEAFGQAVMEEAEKSAPKQDTRTLGQRRQRDDSDAPPF